jgi:hypothetical protein
MEKLNLKLKVKLESLKTTCQLHIRHWESQRAVLDVAEKKMDEDKDIPDEFKENSKMSITKDREWIDTFISNATDIINAIADSGKPTDIYVSDINSNIHTYREMYSARLRTRECCTMTGIINFFHIIEPITIEGGKKRYKKTKKMFRKNKTRKTPKKMYK